MSEEEEELENRAAIFGALKTLREKLEASRTLPEAQVYTAVREALDEFTRAHEDKTLASPIEEDTDPWANYTGVRFGLGDDVDQLVDLLEYYGSKKLKRATAVSQRDVVLRIATDLIPRFERGLPRAGVEEPSLPAAREPEPETEDPTLPGGRRKRASKKKTKKVVKKKAKKTRRSTKRR